MKSFDIKTIICVACIILGVIVQFLIYPGVITFVAGSLLIAVPPFFLAPKSIEIPKTPSRQQISTTTRYQTASRPKKSIGANLDYCDAKASESIDPDDSDDLDLEDTVITETTENTQPKAPTNPVRWLTIPNDKLSETFEHAIQTGERIPLQSDMDDFMFKGCLSYFIMVPVILIGIWAGLSDQPHIGAFIINLALIPLAYFKLKFGTSYRKSFNSQPYALSSSDVDNNIKFKRSNIQFIYDKTSTLSPDMQFELTHIDDRAYFTDVRINYPIPALLPNILCSMVSIAINNDVCPYSYYVLVFKGEHIKNDTVMTDFINCSKSGDFRGTVSVKDGNTILVVTKYKGIREYETEFNDCEVLCDIIAKLNQCILDHKDQIANIC